MAITSEFNGFGLEWEEVVESFPGAIESDFATNSKCGSYIIEREIERAEGLLVSKLNQTTIDILDEIPWHEVSTVAVSGVTGSTFEFDFIPDLEKDIKVYVASDSCYGENSLGLCGSDCGEFDICDDSTSLEDITVYIDEDDRYFGILDRVIESDEKIYISYSVDKSQFRIASLEGILRDIVCCQMGTALYSEGENTWGLVDIFCDNKASMFEMLKSNRWIPGEFKSLNFVNSVIPTGFKSVKILRN